MGCCAMLMGNCTFTKGREIMARAAWWDTSGDKTRGKREPGPERCAPFQFALTIIGLAGSNPAPRLRI